MKTTKTIRLTPFRRNLRPATSSPLPATRSTAFTLIELMVVIAIIVLVAATAMPTLTALFTSGADAQAYNILAAQLAAARALAITKGTYAGVHVQMADNPEYAGKCYAAIIWDDRTYAFSTNKFTLAPGYQPRALPGTMAFGQISDTYINDGAYDSDALDTEERNDTGYWPGRFTGFTTFTIIFNPAGEVVTNIDGETIDIPDPNIMRTGTSDFPPGSTQLWRAPVPEYGVQAVTLFDYKVVRSLSNERSNGSSPRTNFLNEYGQFLVLNLYTGQFFHRE